jgi:hypothetical protein
VSRTKRVRCIRNGLAIGMAALLMVLLNTATANAQRHDWVRNWDCGSSREAVWHVRIYDPGPADRHTIYSSPNEKANSFGREGPVDQVFYLSDGLPVRVPHRKCRRYR